MNVNEVHMMLNELFMVYEFQLSERTVPTLGYLAMALYFNPIPRRKGATVESFGCAKGPRGGRCRCKDYGGVLEISKKTISLVRGGIITDVHGYKVLSKPWNNRISKKNKNL